MPSRRRSRKLRIATQAADLAWSVPQVMAHRLARVALAGSSPSARDRRELHRMGAEKIAAFYESWNAMFVVAFRAYLSFARSPFPFGWFPWTAVAAPRRWSARSQRTALDIVGSGLAPIQRRASANARRLRRTRIL